VEGPQGVKRWRGKHGKRFWRTVFQLINLGSQGALRFRIKGLEEVEHLHQKKGRDNLREYQTKQTLGKER